MSRQDLKDLIDFSKKFGLMSYKFEDVLIAYNTCLKHKNYEKKYF